MIIPAATRGEHAKRIRSFTILPCRFKKNVDVVMASIHELLNKAAKEQQQYEPPKPKTNVLGQLI
jgi:hypothetical protein